MKSYSLYLSILEFLLVLKGSGPPISNSGISESPCPTLSVRAGFTECDLIPLWNRRLTGTLVRSPFLPPQLRHKLRLLGLGFPPEAGTATLSLIAALERVCGKGAHGPQGQAGSLPGFPVSSPSVLRDECRTGVTPDLGDPRSSGGRNYRFLQMERVSGARYPLV